MYEDYFAAVMNVSTGKGWYELNDGRQDLDWLRRRYPEDPALHGAEPARTQPSGAGLRAGPLSRANEGHGRPCSPAKPRLAYRDEYR